MSTQEEQDMGSHDNRQGRPDWHIYLGTGQPHDAIAKLPVPPPWRRFSGRPAVASRPPMPETEVVRARTYRPDPHAVEMVNAALYLRRPLLVTGKPGTGKSTLAFSVAHELGLGPVLYWPITSRSTIQDGLYSYDAIGRLQEVNVQRVLRTDSEEPDSGADIGRFISLGPLGTALLPAHKPRVLLIDELDKSDVDLPNDLLNVFEEGRFTIPELARQPDERSTTNVFTFDGETTTVERGSVRCQAFPMVVITSNGEREFPPAFRRRCLQADLRPPGAEELAAIVQAHLGGSAADETRSLIDRFLTLRERSDVTTDQLLNAIYLTFSAQVAQDDDGGRLVDAILRTIDGSGP
jgi:MoxR-like ATPase